MNEDSANHDALFMFPVHYNTDKKPPLITTLNLVVTKGSHSR